LFEVLAIAITHQAKLLDISQSNLYDLPRATSDRDLIR
jgi:hypothetical protein